MTTKRIQPNRRPSWEFVGWCVGLVWFGLFVGFVWFSLVWVVCLILFVFVGLVRLFCLFVYLFVRVCACVADLFKSLACLCEFVCLYSVFCLFWPWFCWQLKLSECSSSTMLRSRAGGFHPGARGSGRLDVWLRRSVHLLPGVTTDPDFVP